MRCNVEKIYSIENLKRYLRRGSVVDLVLLSMIYFYVWTLIQIQTVQYKRETIR